jgi:hypothetical protein
MSTQQMQPAVTPIVDTAERLGSYKVVQGYRDGTISTTDFFARMAKAGRMVTTNFGTVATQLTFLAQAANRPDFWVRVPSGTAIIPFAVGVALGAYAGTVTTFDLRIAQNDIGNGTSTAASVAPTTTRTDLAYTPATTARQLATADTTAETNPLTIHKRTINTANAAGNDGAGSFVVTNEMMGHPLLIGAATLEAFIWATTTQATGYAYMTYVETPSNWWT